MNRMRAFVALCVPAIASSAAAQPPAVPPIPTQIQVIERFPEHVVARLQKRDRELVRESPANVNGLPLRFVIDDTRRWSAGQKLIIGFRGGTADLHKSIAEAASEWTRHANLEFDFGLDPASGKYREWTPADAGFTCHIRISFDQEGYWSYVGRDSIDLQVVQPGEASMNFEGFTLSLPPDWSATVLHEFGHAIGFHHEHQNPLGGCDQEFDWSRLYEYLGGPPNNWPDYVVDHNLRSLPDTDAYLLSSHDPQSIMHYAFPAWFFVRGEASPCYVARNGVLSTGDAAGALQAYPRDQGQITVQMERRTENLKTLMEARGIGPRPKEMIRNRLEQMKPEKLKANRP